MMTVGRISGVGCAATAAAGHNALAMIAGREGECLTALIERLDKAVGR